MTTANYAVLPEDSNQVENVIVATADFSLTGYILQVIQDGVFCEPGMYYNVSDGLYYQDQEFTTIYPVYESDSL